MPALVCTVPSVSTSPKCDLSLSTSGIRSYFTFLFLSFLLPLFYSHPPVLPSSQLILTCGNEKGNQIYEACYDGSLPKLTQDSDRFSLSPLLLVSNSPTHMQITDTAERSSSERNTKKNDSPENLKEPKRNKIR